MSEKTSTDSENLYLVRYVVRSQVGIEWVDMSSLPIYVPVVLFSLCRIWLLSIFNFMVHFNKQRNSTPLLGGVTWDKC